jgi:elongation factor 1-gamma
VAKANKLDLEIVEVETGVNASADYKKLNKLGKIPTFQGSDGYVLSECIAIAIYRKQSSYL